MAETSGPGPKPAVDSSASASTPTSSFSLSLKISGSHRTAGGKDGIMPVGVFYEQNRILVTEAVNGALKKLELQVRNITANSKIMIVELDFDQKKHPLLFVEEDGEKKKESEKKVRKKIEKKLKDIGFKGKLDVTIAIKEEVDNKMDQIR